MLLPLFPLQLVVYPEENLNLHIFEPRYKQLIRECEEEGVTFGIPAFIDGKVKEIGTEIKLLSVEKRYPNGEMDITSRGIGLFRIKELFNPAPDKLYIGASFDRFDFTTNGDVGINTHLIILIKELFELLKIEKEPPTDPHLFTSYEIAHYVGLSLEQKYELLILEKESDRQHYLLDHLQKMLPVVREMEAVRKRAQMNGHFKNVIPPNV